MVDKRAIAQDLTSAFIEYQYRLENPMPSPTDQETAVRTSRYRCDLLFRAKVNSMVAGVMRILDKHI